MSRLILILLAVGLLSACQSSPTVPSLPPTPTPSTAPAAIRLTASSRSDQQIDVTATVLTNDGHFVANVAVAFAVGAGTVAPSTVTTDANGVAKTVASTPAPTNVTATAGSLTASVNVLASAPPVPPPSLTVSLSAPSVTLGTATTLTAAIIGPPVTGVTFSFGDGSPDLTGTGATVSHLYATAGTYTATVTVTDTLGRIARSTALANVTAPVVVPPVVPALTLTLGCSNAALVVSCNLSATDELGAIVTANLAGHVTWDLGDGSIPATNQGALKMATYGQPGVYVIVASATIGIRSGTAHTTVMVK